MVECIFISTYVPSSNFIFIFNLFSLLNLKNIFLKVDDAYNEHRIYILNSKYFLNSSSNVIENDFGLAKDDAIWRPNYLKFNPCIADISAPFEIQKKENNDSILLIKDNREIQILLKPYNIK